MDVVVNSQVQSPFVRTLESISTKGAAFTHHIPDNVPPISQTRVVVDFGNTDTDYLGKTVSCTIPQYGYLQRVVLKYTVKITTGSTTYARHTLTPFMAYSLTNMCELRTRNRPIQSMYGREMLMRAFRCDNTVNTRALAMSQAHIVSSSKFDNSERQYHGYTRAIIGSEDDFRYGKSAAIRSCTMDRVFADGDRYTLVCYVELPLASTMSLAHCFNTRFVEPLTLTLTLGGPADIFPCYTAVRSANTGMQKEAPKVSVQALCYFLNYHDLTEQDIRNANFRPDAPAVVKAYDTLVEPPVHVKGKGRGSDSVEVSVPIRSTVFTYGMSVCASVPDRDPDQPSIVGVAISYCTAKNQSGGYKETDLPTSGILRDYDFTAGTSTNAALVMYSVGGYSFSSVKFQGSGQTLIDTNSLESSLCDSFDHSLSTWSNKGRECSTLRGDAQSVPEVVANSLEASQNSYYIGSALPANNSTPFQATWNALNSDVGGMYLSFGLSRNESYNSGGVGLQTIANPTLKLILGASNHMHPPLLKTANVPIATAPDATTALSIGKEVYTGSIIKSNEIPSEPVESKASSSTRIYLGLDGSQANIPVAGTGGNANYVHAARNAIDVKFEGTGRVGIPLLQAYTYIHHHALVQIDSGTGAITRSIDA